MKPEPCLGCFGFSIRSWCFLRVWDWSTTWTQSAKSNLLSLAFAHHWRPFQGMTVIADWANIAQQAEVQRRIDASRDGYVTYMLCIPRRLSPSVKMRPERQQMPSLRCGVAALMGTNGIVLGLGPSLEQRCDRLNRIAFRPPSTVYLRVCESDRRGASLRATK